MLPERENRTVRAEWENRTVREASHPDMEVPWWRLRTGSVEASVWASNGVMSTRDYWATIAQIGQRTIDLGRWTTEASAKEAVEAVIAALEPIERRRKAAALQELVKLTEDAGDYDES